MITYEWLHMNDGNPVLCIFCVSLAKVERFAEVTGDCSIGVCNLKFYLQLSFAILQSQVT